MGKKTLNEMAGALAAFSPVIPNVCVFNVSRHNLLPGQYRQGQAKYAMDELKKLAVVIDETIAALELEEGLSDKQD